MLRAFSSKKRLVAIRAFGRVPRGLRIDKRRNRPGAEVRVEASPRYRPAVARPSGICPSSSCCRPCVVARMRAVGVVLQIFIIDRISSGERKPWSSQPVKRAAIVEGVVLKRVVGVVEVVGARRLMLPA